MSLVQTFYVTTYIRQFLLGHVSIQTMERGRNSHSQVSPLITFEAKRKIGLTFLPIV
jgi:hypothetical protein